MKKFWEELKVIKGKDIYLDYNILIELEDLEKNNSKLFQEYLDILHQHNVYYSYGHLEELSTCKKQSVEVNERLKFIEKITKNNEIIFDNHQDFNLIKFIKKQENINSCFSRVQASSTYNEYQDKKLEIAHTYRQIDEIKSINNIPQKDFFYNEKVNIKFEEFLNKSKEEIKKKEQENSFLLYHMCNVNYDLRTKLLFETLLKVGLIYEEEIINDLLKVIKDKKIEIIRNKLNFFKYTERLIEMLFNFLYMINYYKEKEKNSTYRGKTFDVTHCIFATQMDYFVTADKRLFYKMKVIFDFLDIKTKLILVKFENESTTNKIEVLANE